MRGGCIRFFIIRNASSSYDMYLVAIGWMYVVLMMAVAEAMSNQGSVLGAMVTFVLYGLLPLAVVLYIGATPARKRLHRERAAIASAAPASTAPHGASVAASDAAAAEGKKA